MDNAKITCLASGLLLSLTGATTALAQLKLPERMVIPKKLTVGPYDNYQGQVAGKGSGRGDGRLYYTRSINLTNRIYSQPVGSSAATPLLDSSGDSKDPAPSPSGSKVAFTYFKHNATGDICVVSSEGKDPKCFKTPTHRDSAPFWLDEGRLGFVRRDVTGFKTSLMQRDLATGKESLLAEGQLTSPSFDPSSGKLVFNEIPKGRSYRQFVVMDVATKRRTAVKLDLPGVSGMTYLAAGGKALYFSQYLNDTNYDQIIDGNDHSVIFRLPLTDSKAKPLQLTSVESNCNFPFGRGDRLYMTCAFEGSLDIYSIPSTGVVPPSWQLTQLWSAHRAARSPEERLLILQHIAAKSPNMTELARHRLTDRVISNHLALNETAAASFYVDQQWTSLKSNRFKPYYQGLLTYLQLQEAKNLEVSDLVSPRLRAAATRAKRRAKRVNLPPALASVINGYADTFLGNIKDARSHIKRFPFGQNRADLGVYKYLAINLSRKILGARGRDRLAKAYGAMMTDSTLTREVNIYYAYEFLQFVEKAVPAPRQRQAFLRQTVNSLPKDHPARSVLTADVLALDVALAKDDKAAKAEYQKLRKLVYDVRSQFYVKKAVFVRTINILSHYQKIDYATKVASDWLRYTDLTDIELQNAGALYTYMVLDKAYVQFDKKDAKQAASLFYLAVRHSNDLEGHYGYIVSRVQKDKGYSKELTDSYNQLAKGAKYASSLPFYQGMKAMGAPPQLATKDQLEAALSAWEKVPLERNNPAVKYLVSGYAYLRLMLLSKDKMKYDKELFQKAHQQLILALDLGRDNFRVIASGLEHLGFLHFSVGNYSISSQYYGKRMKLPFVAPRNEVVLRSLYSRSLFYAHIFDLAAKNMAMNVATVGKNPRLKAEFQAPTWEKAGFYSMYAKNYPAAIRYYRRYLAKGGSLSPENRAKAELALGYCLKNSGKAGEQRAAEQQLLKANGQFKKLTARKSSKTDPLGFQPLKQRAIITGLLAATASKEADKRRYLKERLAILERMAKEPKLYATTGDRIAADQIKAETKLALSYAPMAGGGSPKLAEFHWNKVLELVSQWQEDQDPLAAASYTSAANVLSFYNAGKRRVPAALKPAVLKVTERIRSAFKEIDKPTPRDSFRDAKLALLQAKFANPVTFAVTSKNLLANSRVASLQQSDPTSYGILQAMSRNLAK